MNLVILHGRLGQDPELRFSQGGVAVLRLSVATDDDVKRGDKWEKETTWHRVVMFGKRAEGVSKHLSKGDAVVVHGRIKNGSYEKEGVKRYTSDVIVDQFEFAGSKREGAGRSSNDESRASSGGEGTAPRGTGDGIGSGGRKTDQGPPDDFNPDDDIPF